MGRPKGSKNKPSAKAKVKVARPRNVEAVRKVGRKRRIAVPARHALEASKGNTEALLSALSEFAAARRTLISGVTMVVQLMRASFIDAWLGYARNVKENGHTPKACVFCNDLNPNLSSLLGLSLEELDSMVEKEETTVSEDEPVSAVADVWSKEQELISDEASNEAAEEAINSITEYL